MTDCLGASLRLDHDGSAGDPARPAWRPGGLGGVHTAAFDRKESNTHIRL